MVFVGNCSSSVTIGIRSEMVEIEIPVLSVGVIFSMVSVLFISGYQVTEDDFFRGWNPVLVF